MPPKRRKWNEVPYDVVAGDLSNPVDLGRRIAACLQQKAYCLADVNIGRELLREAVRGAQALQATPRFSIPPAELLDGLLGPEGSVEICELGAEVDGDDVYVEEGPGLRQADEMLTAAARGLAPFARDLGLKLESRSAGLLHSAGASREDEAPQLTEATCRLWLERFSRQRLLLVLFLGPTEGVLELRPFAHEDALTVEVNVEPGTLAVIRADALTHRFASTARSLSLSCWLSQDSRDGLLQEQPLVETPAYKELWRWATERLGFLKGNQVIGDEGQEWDPTVPKEWQALANRMYHVGPQVGVRSLACKMPTSYSVNGFWRAMNAGVDWPTLVPILRWDHSNAYDPNADSWKFSKTCCKHACFIDGTELFDCKFFGISVMESRSMDPMQRHILETSYEALHFAGHTKKSLMRSLVGVYIGASTSEFNYLPATDASAGTGGANSITSNRISFCLGMQGPSYTVDSQGASSLSALNAATMSLRLQTTRYQPNHTALVGGVYLMIAPQTWIIASAQRWLSPQGRCFTFDASADGYVKSEGVANLVLSPIAEQVDGQQVMDDSQPLEAIVASTAMNHTGQGAALSAASGPQERALVLAALRQAGIAASDVDAVECWGQGSILQDAVETQVLRDALRGEDPDVPLSLGAGKANFGMMSESAGMAALLKVVVGQKYGVQVPCLHLMELNPHIDVWTGEEPLLFGSENFSFHRLSSYTGTTAKSLGGTMVHAITFGFIDPSRRQLRRRVLCEPLAFWPGGGGELPESLQPSSSKPYHIVGSWSEWAGPAAMQDEGGGVYGYTVTLGHDCVEEFQLLLDGQPDRVLHPAVPGAPSGSPVEGPTPDSAAGHPLRWRIDGRGSTSASSTSGKILPVSAGDEHGVAVRSPGADLKLNVPALRVGTQVDDSLPGALYRVRLRVAGRWRSVDWERVSDGDPLSAEPFDDDARYYVVGSWDSWRFGTEMEQVPGVPGLYSASVGPLPKGDSGNFLIVRNQDWSLTYHPHLVEDWGEQGRLVSGPAPRPSRLRWSLEGRTGDIFRIEFQRSLDGRGAKMVSWRRVGGRWPLALQR